MRLLKILLCLILLQTSAFGAVRSRETLLKDSSNNEIEDLSLTSGVAVFSETIDISRNQGFGVLVLTEDQGGGTGDVDVSVEYSVDGSNWYTAYETADPMDGTLTADGNIVTALSNTTRYIQFTIRLATFLRFKFDPDANSELTAHFIYLQ